jgi:tetratricopeptide (TPR) repeat protein
MNGYSVYISARHTMSKFLAYAVFQFLHKNGIDAFYPPQGNDLGELDNLLFSEISARQLFLVILEPYSLDRCISLFDWFRREIEYAIEHDRQIILLTTSLFSQSDIVSFLPRDVAARLEHAKNVEVPYKGFQSALPQLLQILESSVPFSDTLPSETHKTAISKLLERAHSYPQITEQHILAEEYFISCNRHISKCEWVEAVSRAEAAIRKAPTIAKAYSSMGRAECGRKKFDAAIISCTKGIEIDPTYPFSYINRAKAWMGKGNLKNALADYQFAIERAPNLVDIYIARGCMYQDQGQFDQALDDFMHVIELTPLSAGAYINRGHTFHQKKDFPSALSDFEQALQIDPFSVSAYSYRAWSFYDQGELDASLADCNMAIKLDPTCVSAYLTRSAINALQEKLDDAVEDADTVIRIAPKNEYAYVNRAEANHRKGGRFLDFALEDFSRAIDLNPKHVPGYVGLAYVLFEKGDYKAALNKFTQAIQLSPNDAALYISRAGVRAHMTNSVAAYKMAIEDLDKAIQLDNRIPAAYVSRAHAKAKLRDYRGAVEDGEKALKINPNYSETKSFREFLAEWRRQIP